MKPFAAMAVLLTVSTVLAAVTVKPDQQKLGVNTGMLGSFGFEYPIFLNAQQKPIASPVQKDITGDKVKLTYDGGTTVDISHSNGEITYTISKVPKDAKHFRTSTLFGQERINNWTVEAGKTKTAFPAQKPPSYIRPTEPGAGPPDIASAGSAARRLATSSRE